MAAWPASSPSRTGSVPPPPGPQLSLSLPVPGHPVLVCPQAAPEWRLFLFFTQQMCIEHLLCVQQRPHTYERLWPQLLVRSLPPQKSLVLGAKSQAKSLTMLSRKRKQGSSCQQNSWEISPLAVAARSSGLSLHLGILATRAPSPPPTPAWLPPTVGRTCRSSHVVGMLQPLWECPGARPWGWVLATWVCGAQSSWCWGLGSRDQALSRPHFPQGQLESPASGCSSPTRT